MMTFISFRWVLGAFFALYLASGSQAAERLTGEDIGRIIRQSAQDEGISLTPVIPPQRVFYPCASGLQVTPKTQSWQTVTVSCSKPYDWKLNFRTKMKFVSQKPMPANPMTSRKAKPRSKEFTYVVLKEPLSKGTVLSQETEYDIKTYHYEIRGAFTNVEHLLGRRLKTSVPVDVPLLSRYLTTAYAVEKDNIINIILQRGSIKISGKAIALSDGQLGEVILVSNLESGIKLRARIKNEREAEIITKQLN